MVIDTRCFAIVPECNPDHMLSCWFCTYYRQYGSNAEGAQTRLPGAPYMPQACVGSFAQKREPLLGTPSLQPWLSPTPWSRRPAAHERSSWQSVPPTATATLSTVQTFSQTWTAEILKSPPLIAPARQFTYPRQIAGEEDALARGALQLLVRPATEGQFLATCALGFTDPSMPTGIHPCPNPDHLCAVAGGYAYMIDTAHPETSTHIALRPVVEVRSLPGHNLILFTGFHTILAWGADGEAWQTQRLSWEGIHITAIEGDTLHGTGWNLPTDQEVPFTVDLRSGQHTGGGFS
jgi:hypothetical protein